MSELGARVGRKRGGEAGLGISRLGRVLIVAALVASALPSLFISSASAAPILTITPITWNVVGLDSNDVNAGSNMFASGARVCNTGSSAATNVVTNYIWDTANANINLSPGSPSTLSTATLTAGSCFDFYYNLTITRTAAAYNTTRRYHITATADTLGTISTPVPREIFVEHLVSQNRNSVTAITGPGGVGDPPTTTVFVGQTYTYKLFSSTATNGYEQLTTFLNFPNVIFQVLSVNQTYTAPPGGTNDKIYADACGWDNVIASATYQSCIGPDQYAGGKAGGTVVTTYVVKILSTGTTTISALIYDFSGSSYHYNNDFGVGVNSVTITAVAATDLAITKSDSPDPVIAGNNLTYTLGITNNGPSDATGVSISDPIPAGTSFVSASGGGTLSAGTVTWAVGALANGASTSRTLTVTVDPSRVAALSNTATVSSTTAESTPGNNSATEATTVNTSADLSITKSDSPDPVIAGNNLTYTLGITNNGPSDATGVSISDAIPAGTSFVSASGGGTLAAGTVTWATGALANGASTSRTLTVSVNSSRTTNLSNTATVSATTTDPTPGNNSATEATTVNTSADLYITKSDSPDPVIAGNNLTYTLGITNNGPSDATGVSISDAIPAGTSFVSASGGGTLAAGTVTWAIGALASGVSTSRTLTVTVNSSRTADLSNTATVSGNQSDPTPANNSATETTTVNTSADLSITKSDSPDPVIAGNNLTYTIDITNSGSSDATGVSISDPIPAGTSFVSASGGGSLAAGTVTWAIGALASGASTSRTLTVTVDPSRTADLSNTATVSATTTDPTPGNDDATETTTVNTSADLSITKSDSPDPVPAGGNLTYTIDITNNGPSDATGVSISDPIPAGTSFVSASNGGSLAAGTVTWTIGALASGTSASGTLVVTVSPLQTADLSNTATVTATTADPTPGNNSDTETTVVGVSADLSITKSDSPDPVIAGNNLTYTIDITNNGPSDATGVSISDPIPAGTSFVSASNGGSLAAGTVTWAIGNLASGASRTRTLFVTVNPSRTADLSNTATVSGDQSDPTPGNNDATETTTVNTSADLSITKSDSPDPVAAGNDVTYTLGITNNGPSDATGVSISDPIPAGTTFVSASGGGTLAAGTVTWAIGNLASGASASRTLIVSVDPSQSADLSNTATASANQTDPTPANNAATETTAVTQTGTTADLSITKSDSPDPAVAGATLTYTIVATNNGPDDATGVTVTDVLPAGLDFVSATSAGADCQESGGMVSCDVGNLASGASVTMKIKVTPTNEGTITNTASVGGDQTDPTPANNSATESTQVNGVSDLAVTKTASTANPVEGDTIIYTIALVNNGPSDATGVVLKDLLPDALTFVSADAGQGTFDASTGRWDVGNLNNGDQVDLQIAATVDPGAAGTSILNHVRVAALDQTDPTAVNDVSSASVSVLGPTLPFTGDDISGLLIALVTLLLVGSASLWLGRRRAHQPKHAR
jgi:large repetitive protein